MASAWKDLPEELSEPARLLAEELRTIKDTAGLSLSELAGRTHYSRASWERWLNGKRVVTEQALEALIRAVDCDAAALRRLWRRATERTPEVAGAEVAGAEVADAEVAHAEEPTTDEPTAETVEGPSARTAAEPAGEPVPTAEEAPEAAVAWWRRPAALVSGAVLLGLLLVLVGLRVSRHDDQASAADAPAATATPATAKPAPSDPPCRAVGCAHKDPKTTGCGKDARTLQTQVIGKVVVYLRYSRTCQAAWAAITEGEPKDYAVITDSTGDSETAMIHWGYDNYSAMLNAADPSVGFQVCGSQPAGHDCTSTVTDLASVVASTPIPIGPASPPPGAGAGAATPSDSAPPSQAPPTDQPSPSPSAP
ncbi:DUF2690 domain-containing protein [Kitasatospora aureofaciens]|uniref:HTH cro/C1-type domain-containing protein n=1 Tax=Kitasatospora aureofaciens TaxID=1894 RepID=A0A1E7MY78_KITAU|nr:XRE family transcriptional regulator [Kitasatospora aureofaciens]OEV33398.1 hypothetical protein HS99_0012480 [Kitasatospora aureofaciens]GGU59593.1 hypothetical protein GCM10010502_07450 [Kitasatospora aureofaciens]